MTDLLSDSLVPDRGAAVQRDWAARRPQYMHAMSNGITGDGDVMGQETMAVMPCGRLRSAIARDCGGCREDRDPRCHWRKQNKNAWCSCARDREDESAAIRNAGAGKRALELWMACR